MKIVIQRVLNASVTVDGSVIGKIDRGLLLLVCAERGDSEESFLKWAKRIPDLRVFTDEQGKMNLSLNEIQGELLVVSQFTLAADLNEGGRRPGFSKAAPPEDAKKLLECFLQEVRKTVSKVETGRFGADMKVALTNDGPVTLIVQ